MVIMVQKMNPKMKHHELSGDLQIVQTNGNANEKRTWPEKKRHEKKRPPHQSFQSKKLN
jgi:hypothetical protein